MRGVQDFLRDSLPAMIDYIVVVSTPANEMMAPTNTAEEMNRHDRLQIANALRQRKKTMTTLDREAILNLPHLVDVPRHLAIITSAVIRSSRELSARPRTGDDTDLAVDEFCSKCFEVEEEAIFRVSQLATKLASENGRRVSIQGVIMTGSTVSEPLDRQMPRSPIPEVTGTVISTSPRPTRRRKSLRPSTAPSPTESNRSYQQVFSGNENASSSQRIFTPPKDERRPWDDQTIPHHKSPSIDSFPHRIIRDASTPGRLSSSAEIPLIDSGDDPAKRKKGLLRGILRR